MKSAETLCAPQTLPEKYFGKSQKSKVELARGFDGLEWSDGNLETLFVCLIGKSIRSHERGYVEIIEKNLLISNLPLVSGLAYYNY